MTQTANITNAIEEIAKTQPKENAGSSTSLRYEYQMNWGLNKLLELEESGEDYVMAFDYHDDIIIFDREINATAVDFYQIKTKKNGEWSLTQLFNPNVETDETELPEKDENEVVESKEEKDDHAEIKDNKKKLSYMAKLLSHSLLISSSRNFYFVTNRQFKKTGFKRTPTGKLLTFDDIDEQYQKKIRNSLPVEEKELDVDKTASFFILQDQIPLDGFKRSLHGAVHDFLKKKAPNAEIDAEVFYETLLNRIIRTRNNYDEGILETNRFLDKKCFTKSKFSELISRLACLESFSSRVQKITIWLNVPQIMPYEADEIQQQLTEIRKDMSLYGNMSLARLVNKTRDIIDNNRMDRTDTSYLAYAQRLVGILKSEMPEANNYTDNYLVALALYEKAK